VRAARLLAAAAVGALVAAGGGQAAAGPAGAARAAAAPPARWHPAPGLSWQLQLSGKLDLSVAADAVEVDGLDTTAATVAALHAAGKRAVCYVDAGSWERWRGDAQRFPAAILGRPLDGWPDERWLDIRRLDVLLPLLRARIADCAGKGFDGIEFDNVDGYANRTGFPLRAVDQLRFNRRLATEAHRRGLAVGLKNDLGQVRQLAASFDWAVDEQCFEFDECAKLLPFVARGKPVVVIEYATSTGMFCAAAAELGFDAMRKRLALDAWRQACPRLR
jgi:hypothetical protein